MKITIIGAEGRMGKAIREIAVSQGFVCEVGVVRQLPAQPASDVRLWMSSSDMCNGLPLVQSPLDLIIDFSSPQLLASTLEVALKLKLPLLVGTTGLTQEHIEMLQSASKKIPVLNAPNTSLGIAVLSELVKRAAQLLPANLFDVELFEIHHKKKKDGPSGTAKLLASQVLSADNKRHDTGLREKHRQSGEVAHAYARGGDVVGEHTVFFLGEGERIELVHRCQDRLVFARGAIELGQILMKKSAGYYSPLELLLSDKGTDPQAR